MNHDLAEGLNPDFVGGDHPSGMEEQYLDPSSYWHHVLENDNHLNSDVFHDSQSFLLGDTQGHDSQSQIEHHPDSELGMPSFSDPLVPEHSHSAEPVLGEESPEWTAWRIEQAEKAYAWDVYHLTH